MDSRTVKIGFLIGLVLGVGVVAGAATLDYYAPVTDNDRGFPIQPSDTGPNLTIQGDINMSFETNASDVSHPPLAPDDNSLYIASNKGNMSVSSNGETDLTVDASEITGDWTNATNLNVTNTAVTINPEDKQSVSVSGGATDLSFTEFGVDDGTSELVLDGSGTATVTITGLSADTAYYLYATGENRYEAQFTTDASGNATVSVDLSSGTLTETFTNGNIEQDFAGTKRTLQIRSTGPLTQSPVTYNADSGPTVNLGSGTTGYLSSPFPSVDTVNISTDAGDMTVRADGGSLDITPNEITGPWTNITAITAGSTWIEVAPEDKANFSVRGSVNEFAYTSQTPDDGNIDFVYNGTDGGITSVELYNLSPDTIYKAYDPASNTYLDSSTSDSSGTLVLDMPNSEHSVELLSEDGATAPTVSNLSPTGLLDYEPSNIEFDVSDPDFAEDDNVSVTTYLDGSEIDQQYITSNSSLSVAIPQSGQTGGEHDIRVNATDSFEKSTDETGTYSTPDKLYIRNELNHSELITSPVNTTVTFFGPEATYEREATDGTVNLTGLPVNTDFTVSAIPSDNNWTSRTAYIQSVYDQQSIYLLNITAVDTVVENRFILDDPTGEFGAKTTLFIQRPITVNESTVYKTIHADQFGVEGVTASLESGIRYRIKIQSEDGQSQIVGPYRAELAETVTVEPGTPGIQIEGFEDGLGYAASIDNQTVKWRYSDPSQETDELTVYIHEKGDKNNLLVANESYFDLGNASREFTITANESEKAWVVNFITEKSDGETITHTITLQNQKDLFGQLDAGWQATLGVGLLVLFAAAFSVLNAAIGAVVVSLAGGLLWWIGLLGGVTTAMSVAIAIFISVAYYLATQGRP